MPDDWSTPKDGRTRDQKTQEFPRKGTKKSTSRVPRRTCLLQIAIVLLGAALVWPCQALSKSELSILQRERSEAALKWAPLIWLHPEESFFPDSVHTFLKHVVPKNVPESTRPPEPPVLVSMSRSLNTVSTLLPEGPASKDTYLIAPIDPACRNCPLPRFLHGTKPTRNYMPAVYAVITSCLPTKKSIRPRSLPRRRFMARTFRRFKHKKGRAYIRESRHVDSSHFFENKTPPKSYESLSANKYEADEHHKQSFKKKANQPKLPDSTELNTLGTTSHYNDIVQEENNLIASPISTLLPPEPYGVAPTNTSYVEQTSLDMETTTEIQPTTGSFHSLETTVPEIYETVQSTTSSYSFIHDFTQAFSPGSENVLSDFEDTETRVTQDPETVTSTHKSYDTNTHKNKRLSHLRGHKFTVTYWMFYPFSQGKRVCTRRLWLLGRIFKPRIRSKCYGELITLNSHVGDWEHISIFFEDGMPQRLYVSTHTYGAYYHYHPSKKVFLYRGKDTRLGLPLNPKFPSVVKMEGTHPVLYAAHGSHGLWGAPGVHRYEKLVPLEDKTAAGTRWNTWANVDIIDYRSPDLERPDRQWLNFNGKWGNPAHGCHRALFGSCDLANGPTGIPLKRANFPCYLPQHPTFYPKL